MNTKNKSGGSGLNKLSALMAGGPSREPHEESAAEDDEQIAADAQQVLELVAKIAGENIFDMQALIEFCADELRVQIREDREGGEG